MKDLSSAATLQAAISSIREEAPTYFDAFVGRVFLINDNPEFWKKRIVAPTKLTSKLADKDILGFHILAEIKNGIVRDMPSLQEWHSFTLAKVQNSAIGSDLATQVIEELEKWGMINVSEEGNFVLTALGKIPATMYLWPRDVSHWNRGCSRIDELSLWENDLALSYVLGTTPSIQLGYVPANEAADVANYTEHVSEYLPNAYAQSVMAKDLYELISRGVTNPRIRGFQYDIERTQSALLRMNLVGKWNHENALDAIGVRVKYGIKKELAQLCQLPGIGGARAKKLYDAGFETIADVKADHDGVGAVVGTGIAMQISRSFE